MKICSTCNINKPLTDYNHSNGRPYFQCKTCKHKVDYDYYHNRGGRDVVRANRLKNIDTIRASERRFKENNTDYYKGRMLTRYWPGTTWQQALANFGALMEKQHGLCAICARPETRRPKKGSKKRARDLSVDHCHASGKVRGLLCDQCNNLLGKAEDKPHVCRAAADYLEAA